MVAAALLLTAAYLPIAALAALVDLARGRPRLPVVRLVSFGVCWAWLETAGVAAAAALWLTGRRRDPGVHYRLQRWWADHLMRSLHVTCGVSVRLDGVEALGTGPTVLFVRHASLADSLLTAWAVTERAGLRPRVVLKQELLADPCLDIVGNRLPNCFLDRGAEDVAAGLAAISEMGAGTGPGDVAIIFPEGTRSNAHKRSRALERIEERDPDRAERLSGLRHVLPPRPSGSRALWKAAAPLDPAMVLGWHVGFDGLDTFAGILRGLARPATTVRMRFERVDPPPVDDAAFDRWLDDQWLRIDREVDALTRGR